MFVKRSVSLIACAIVTVACSSIGHSEDKIPENEPILGQWKVTSAVQKGKELDNWEGYTYTFRRNGTYTGQAPNGDKLDGKFTLEKTEEDRDFRNIKLESEEDRPDLGGGGPRLGIFKTTSDDQMNLILTICVNQIRETSNHPRPSQFQSKSSFRLLLTLTEVK